MPPCPKKGAVNTPSIIQFFEKENGGFDLSQNRRLAVISIFGRKISTAITAVFWLAAWAINKCRAVCYFI